MSAMTVSGQFGLHGEVGFRLVLWLGKWIGVVVWVRNTVADDLFLRQSQLALRLRLFGMVRELGRFRLGVGCE